MFEQNTKHLTILALALGLAVAASAANVSWTGAVDAADPANPDPNVGYWDVPGNWSAMPTGADTAALNKTNATIIVDDLYPDNLKTAGTINLARQTTSSNVTLWIKSGKEGGPGGVLDCGLLLLAAAGGQNSRVRVDAGQLIVSGRVRFFQTGVANSSGSIIINGGLMTADRMSLTEMAVASQATLTVNGGRLNVAQEISMAASPAVVKINLNGGTLSMGSLQSSNALTIDANGGALEIKGDQTALIAQLVGLGQVTVGGVSAQRGGLSVVYDSQTGKTTIIGDPSQANPNRAWKSQPISGVSGVVADTQSLTWAPGDSTAAKAGHDVYFGTDPNAVSNSSADNALGTYLGRVDVASMPVPVELMLSKTYYWRVDQIDSKGTLTKGALWSFRVANNRIVDDFEAYNNESNKIFTTWKDGWDIADNGMVVGHLDPNYAETKIVKYGKQSMPLFYENKDGVVKSEAKRTFASAQNWTKNGTKSLSLMFRGESANTLGKAYVKINDTKVTYPLLAGHMQLAQWKPWVINFKDVAADLTKVTSLAIGVDGAGVGTLYIDDIRLYDQEAELMPAPGSGVEPDKNTLVAHYLFDGNFQDSSGNGRHGIEQAAAAWVDGPIGKGVDVKTTTGIDCGIFDPTGGTGKFTATMWCYWRGTRGTQHLMQKQNGFAVDTMMFQLEIKAVGADDRMTLAYAGGGSTQARLEPIPYHEWVHIAMAYDGTNATGYLNGVDSVGPQYTPVGKSDLAIPLMIGAQIGGGRLLDGLLDDVRIYSAALTPAQVINTIGLDLGYRPILSR